MRGGKTFRRTAVVRAAFAARVAIRAGVASDLRRAAAVKVRRRASAADTISRRGRMDRCGVWRAAAERLGIGSRGSLSERWHTYLRDLRNETDSRSCCFSQAKLPSPCHMSSRIDEGQTRRSKVEHNHTSTGKKRAASLVLSKICVKDMRLAGVANTVLLSSSLLWSNPTAQVFQCAG